MHQTSTIRVRPPDLECWQGENDATIRGRGRTCDALLKVGVGDEGALQAGTDAELAEDLVLPDVGHVVLRQLIQGGPHMQLLVEGPAVADRARGVRSNVLLHVHHHCR